MSNVIFYVYLRDVLYEYFMTFIMNNAAFLKHMLLSDGKGIKKTDVWQTHRNTETGGTEAGAFPAPGPERHNSLTKSPAGFGSQFPKV